MYPALIETSSILLLCAQKSFQFQIRSSDILFSWERGDFYIRMLLNEGNRSLATKSGEGWIKVYILIWAIKSWLTFSVLLMSAFHHSIMTGTCNKAYIERYICILILRNQSLCNFLRLLVFYMSLGILVYSLQAITFSCRKHHQKQLCIFP